MKPINFTKPGISFVAAAPISLDTGLLILSIDQLFEKGEPFSLLVVKKPNEDKTIMVPENCIDIIIVQNEERIDGYFLSEEGSMWHYNGETIEAIDPLPLTNDILLRSQAYTKKNEHFVVGGFDNFFLKENNQWKQVAIDMSTEIEKYRYVGFDKIVYDSSKDLIYMFGYHGIGYVLSGSSQPEPISLPENRDIHDAVVLNGNVYTCGSNGIIMFGNETSQWELVKNEITKDELWGIATYNERIFVSSNTNIYEIIDGALQPYQYSDLDKKPNNTYKLKSCPDGIWSIGSKHLLKFNGKNWTESLLLG